MLKKSFLWIVLPMIVFSVIYQSGFRAGMEKGVKSRAVVEERIPALAPVPSKKTPEMTVNPATPKKHPRLISEDNIPTLPASEPAVPVSPDRQSSNPSDFHKPPKSVYDRPPRRSDELKPLRPLDR